MKLDEAKKILGSVGYSVSENLDSIPRIASCHKN